MVVSFFDLINCFSILLCKGKRSEDEKMKDERAFRSSIILIEILNRIKLNNLFFKKNYLSLSNFSLYLLFNCYTDGGGKFYLINRINFVILRKEREEQKNDGWMKEQQVINYYYYRNTESNQIE